MESSIVRAPRVRSDIGLGRHQTFHLRAGWLVKALHALKDDPEALSRPDSHHQLGVGKNMLESIRYWTLTADLAAVSGRAPTSRRMQLELTKLGRLLLAKDPYFEDIASLWVIHLALASTETAPAWYWLFNEAEGFELSDSEFFNQFSGWLADAAPGMSFSEPQVRRELSCLRRTYLHEAGGMKSSTLDDQLTCPLSSLNLVRRAESGALQLRVGPKPHLPPEVVLYALQCFALAENRETFSLDDLRWEPRSPGRLLALDAATLSDHLLHAQSHPGSGIHLTQTAGLRSVSIVRLEPTSLLDGYYERHAA